MMEDSRFQPPETGSSRASSTSSGMRAPRRIWTPRQPCILPEVGHLAVTGIPGYAGHIPGKHVENVLGATYQRANEISLVACEARHRPPTFNGRRYNAYGDTLRGSSLTRASHEPVCPGCERGSTMRPKHLP
eukprot:gnl/MRDRNA2_/MRDRNA2_95805_c0_seq1.p1 gnl/MRDRNA2_/MRDRNA2_95805_c0~~gnl/MRDRNA2_/MRDRNA2_95805_c0_seq1.p1  ORF type:complete len:132 (-),score=16.09 gnl/MRDRNA2_/MRDRNA2_95805_c0_seq1:15-410(-)